MAITRKNRDFFKEQNNITNANGSVTPGDRFRSGHEPTQETMFGLVDSFANILEASDAASLNQQGLVKPANGTSAKNGTSPDDGFTYAAKIENLPQVKEVLQTVDTLISTALIKATPQAGETDRNVYDVSLSADFLNWLTGRLQVLDTAVTNLRTDVDVNTAAITDIQADIVTIQGDITSIQDSIATLQADVATLQTDVSNLDDRVTQNEDDITQLQSDVAGFGGDSRVVGELAFMPVESAPSSLYLLCDGAEISRTTYDALFAKIGTTHGSGNGATTFNIPDYSGRGMRGYNSADLANFGPGVNGGSDSVVLTSTQLPPHAHTIGTNTNEINLSDVAGTDYTTVKAGDGNNDGQLDITGSSQISPPDGGNSDPITIRNPYLTTFVYIKVQ